MIGPAPWWIPPSGVGLTVETGEAGPITFRTSWPMFLASSPGAPTTIGSADTADAEAANEIAATVARKARLLNMAKGSIVQRREDTQRIAGQYVR